MSTDSASTTEHDSAEQTTLVVVADPCGETHGRLVAAAQRSGAVGVLDVGPGGLAAAVRDLDRRRVTSYWLRPGAHLTPADVPANERGRVAAVLLGVDRAGEVSAWRDVAGTVVVTVHSYADALAAQTAGADGLLASGREAGGRVGPTEASILLQQTVPLGLPVWVRGGIGPRTAAAAVAGGAAGVLVDVQTGLLRESRLSPEARAALAGMDGSQTRVVGGHRLYTRPDLPVATLSATADEVAARLGSDLRSDLLGWGQDGALASSIAEAYETVGGLVQAIRTAVTTHLATAARVRPLAPGSPLAQAHATTYPIAQGPMTRVSDRADFAAAVADGGALPFLALALLPGGETRALLEETATQLGDRSWGVGVLGFAPPELLAEQLEVVRDVRPGFALVAGGRPSQAADLEAHGITSYLHVPSIGLLDRFLKDGARKFVFEGRECGGHVGPLSSFVLWEAQLERLSRVKDPENLHVLLAGGIHDARSASMAAAALAPLAERGAKVGVLMGTAYLFTAEAVSGGAIQPAFQQVALECSTTALVETAPGHATRCVETDFVRAFAARADELTAEGVPADARWAELEQLNLGRLRIASKGLERTDAGLVEVAEERQRAEGMYMIGEVATMRSRVTTIGELHAEISVAGSDRLVEQVAGPVREREADPLDIAVVGLASLLPGSTDAEAFWADVLAGRDAVTEVPAERWDTDLYHDPAAYDDRRAGRRSPSKWGGFLDPVGFDPLAYGIPPAALAAVEPVQLLSLEVAARALADAGYASRTFDRARASVVFGAESGNDLSGMYGIRAWLPQLFGGELPDALDEWLPKLTEDSFPGVLANVIAGRIANRLDLGGVNYTVDAACASSLAALDAGCKELAAGTSDMVLVGGADLHNGLNDYLMFSSVHALSPSGRCRTFDADADGIALGEGIACVVLKRRVDAERDGDRIYALVDAVAGSSDGRHLGLTAPRKEGQQRAVVRALEQSGLLATDLGLVEAHGTGTVVGDKTEMATLTELFVEAGAEPGSAVLGSVKSQIGHTKCSAGLAGLIKVVKAVHHSVLPPTINLTTPNPYFDAATSPFRFLDSPQPWPDEQRRAGVSAFGFGGTNFHAVVSSYDADDRPPFGAHSWSTELFCFRGRTLADAQRAASEMGEAVARILEVDPAGQRHRLRDLAATAARGTGPVRIALVAGDLADLAEQLSRVPGGTDRRSGVFVRSDEDVAAPEVAFLYPGQGSQRPGMLGELLVTFGGLDDLLRAGADHLPAMFPPRAFTREDRAAQQAAITATNVAQPALGIAAMAMTRLLRRAGVEPDAAGGHSYGELAALAAAGSYDEETLIRLSEARGQSVLNAVTSSGGDPGTMAAVSLTIEEVRALVAERPSLVVANHNAPRQVVVAGPTADVRGAVEAWSAQGVSAKVIPVACAFHSPLIATAGAELGGRLADVELRAPRFPVWSNTTAEPYPTGDDDAVGRLLIEQVTAGVRFVEQVESMYAAGVRVFVEAGPGRVLTQQVGRILGDRPHHAIACDASGESGLRRFLLALAELTSVGVGVDPSFLFEGRADVLDVAALPVATPGWTVDGAFVRRADGTVLPHSLQPATTLPAIPVPSSATSVQGAVMPSSPDASPEGWYGTDPGAVVHEYLRSVRQLVAAERDVMLRYLGADVPVSGAYDDDALAPVGRVPSGGPVPSIGNVSSVEPASPEPASSIEPVDTTPATTRPSVDELMAAVQKVVADRTGYPVDMLEPDLDLEADLSIDSIKRLEIVGELAETLDLGTGLSSDAPDEALVEELARHKTLRAVVAWIDDQLGTTPVEPIDTTPTVPTPTVSSVKPADTTPAAAPRMSVDELMAAVQKVVADRTGYPVDMLEPDLDLEADLSIDSIKRLEIVGELAETLDLGTGLSSDAPDEALVEELARHKTLRAVVAWIDDQLGTTPVEPIDTTPTVSTPAVSSVKPVDTTPAVAVGPTTMREVIVEPLGPTLPIGDLTGRTAAVVTGHGALSDAVGQALADRGASVTLMTPYDISDDHDGEAHQLLAEVDVLVDLSTTSGSLDARTVFTHLRAALLGRAEFVLTVTMAFNADSAPTGVPGLVRALARERTDVLVRSVEIEAGDLSGEVAPVAEICVDELLDREAPLSVSWAGGQRTTKVPGQPLTQASAHGLGLGRDSVVLLTGGARGITARIADELLRASGCRLVLVGRSPLPGEEDPRLADALTPVDLRRALIGTGELRTPGEIEAACGRILADREIRSTIAGLTEQGGRVEYVAADVRGDEFGQLLDLVREQYGRLDAVVHGAGVLDDRFLADKTEAGFDAVFGTKVDGARAILERLEGIGTVILFGSVSGVFGNRGQCDYAAGNDALDTLARAHDGNHGARVIALDWGPWAGGGMVSEDLEREYARRGIGLVAPEDGTAALVRALTGDLDGSQFVVMRGEPEAFAPTLRRTAGSASGTDR